MTRPQWSSLKALKKDVITGLLLTTAINVSPIKQYVYVSDSTKLIFSVRFFHLKKRHV